MRTKADLVPDLEARHGSVQAARTALVLLGYIPCMPNNEGAVPWKRPGSPRRYYICQDAECRAAGTWKVIQAPSP
jgi:hypothetical protein